MPLDGYVIIEPDPAAPPFGMDPGLGRQGLEVRHVDLVEQLAARPAVLTQHPHVVEQRHAFGDRRVDFGQAVKDPVAQPAKKPALDDADAGFDLGLIPGPPRPRRQHRSAVMARHVGVAAIYLGIEVAGLDHRDLGVVGHQQLRRPAEEGERGVVPLDPVRHLLGPGRTGE